MIIKEQIMLTAFDLFSEHGIKNVSMDDIAHNASISKRTLYELFEDKETLLTECINLSYTKMRLSMKRLESEPITALEVALLFYEELMRRPRWFNRKFYDDLKRYPKALQKTEEEKSRFLKKCIKLLSRGAKEGVFQPNINFEIVALLAKEQAKMIRPSKALSNHSVSEVFNTILYTFLRGISTEKGIAILDRYSGAIFQTHQRESRKIIHLGNAADIRLFQFYYLLDFCARYIFQTGNPRQTHE